MTKILNEYILLFLGLWLLCSCASILSIEDLDESTPDAAVSPDAQVRFSVQGDAIGVLQSLSLRLEYSGGDELLSIVDDGPFSFGVMLQPGDSYAVRFVDDTTPCVLEGAVGIVIDAAPALQLVCEGVYVTEFMLAGPSGQKLPLDATTTAYAFDVSLLQSQATFTFKTKIDEATVTINGVTVDQGTASPAIELDLGENIVEVVVTSPGGGSYSYHVAVNRAVDIVQAAYGKASNAGKGDRLGREIALSRDTLAVSAYHEDSAARGPNGEQGDNSAQDSGAVYVFRRTGDTWAQEAYIKASNTDPGDHLGIRVALSGDTLAVSAGGEASSARDVDGDPENNAALASGAVYIFRRTGINWAQEAYIKASNTQADDWFGIALALSGDTLAVRAMHEDSAATGINGDQEDNSAPDSGAVYVFRRKDNTWAQEAYIKASNTDDSDWFGANLALSGDTLAVRASREDSAARGINGDQDDNSATESGAVYVFQRIVTTWAQEAYIKASNTNEGDSFGDSIGLWGDTLAVAAPLEDSAAKGVDGDQSDNSAENSGAVYVFRRTDGTWTQEAYLKASNTDTDDIFGFCMRLFGSTLAVCSRYEASAATGINGDQDDDTAPLSGAVYVFQRTAGFWQQTAYIKASNTAQNDEFGFGVALSGDILAVGAPGEASAATGIDGDQNDNSASSSGAFYIYY